MKCYLASPPILSQPKPDKDQYMYLVVSNYAVSTVLLRHQDRIQILVYYLSKTLVDVETQYLPLEKMALTLMHATRKLPHYFQGHTVWVLTEYPLQSLLRRSYFNGRIANWGMRLRTFGIRYKPRNSIKGQILEDFVVEFTPTPEVFARVFQVLNRPRNVYVDDTSNVRGSGDGIVMISLEGLRLEK